jgi:hypothetical protein
MRHDPAKQFMTQAVLRISDFERRSREPDAVSPRDPSDSAVIIVLPVIRVERYDESPKKGESR